MLTQAKKKLIRSLATKKGRSRSGLMLVEGDKAVRAAGDAVEFAFTRHDAPDEFDRLVSTATPQGVAAVARMPRHDTDSVGRHDLVIALDHVQDPGNVGAILRLCQGFSAGLVLIESADITSPKVTRSSAGAVFSVPWIAVPRGKAPETLAGLPHRAWRLEKRPKAAILGPGTFSKFDKHLIIAGSEGSGIRLGTKAPSLVVPHDAALESLNVGHALAIAMHAAWREGKNR